MNTFGKNFRVTTFGESHGKAVGAIIDGCPAKISLVETDIQKELNRRKPGQSIVTTQRKESDKVEILSGVFEGQTTGTPIMALIYNKDQQSADYSAIKDIFRPGHADETYQNKYGIRDYRGGGRASGRETIGRVIGGAIAKKVLMQIKKDLQITAYTKQIGNSAVEKIDLNVIEQNPFRAPDLNIVDKWTEMVNIAQNNQDSLGGIVEIVIKNMLPNLGSPVFDKLEADLAKALMSIGAVKSFEIGSGFESANLKGSEMNKIEQGIYGGISNGEDIIIRVAVKPTPSIGQKQMAKNLKGQTEEIEIIGRHDPIIMPRLVPVAESMVAMVLLDSFLGL